MDRIPVNIFLKTSVKDQQTETVASGEMTCSDTEFYISYTENDALVNIAAKPDELVIIRHGEVHSELSLLEKVHRIGKCQTAFGIIDLDIYTHKLNISLHKKGGVISALYDVMDQLNNNLYIEITTKED